MEGPSSLFVWVLIVWAAYISLIRRDKAAPGVQRAALVIFGLSLPCLLLELIFSPLGRAVWERAEIRAARARDAEIGAANRAVAAVHPLGFNETWKGWSPTPPGSRLVVVLGDSFVFGDGVAEQDRWSRKLEQKLGALPGSFDVRHWGKNGWSTRAELNFLEETPGDLHIDLLLVGWVYNDTDTGELFPHPWTDRARSSLSFLTAAFPAMTRHIFWQTQEWEYWQWRSALFEPAQLEAYALVLRDFKKFVTERNWPTVFVITPHSAHPFFGEVSQKITPLLDRAGLEYLDLYPKVFERFKDFPQLALQTSPVNPHPGGALAELYAEEAFAAVKSRLSVRENLIPSD